MTANSYMKKLYTVVEHSDLESHIRALHVQFDIICIDPYHEYSESASDFSLLPSFLTDDGLSYHMIVIRPKKTGLLQNLRAVPGVASPMLHS